MHDGSAVGDSVVTNTELQKYLYLKHNNNYYYHYYYYYYYYYCFILLLRLILPLLPLLHY